MMSLISGRLTMFRLIVTSLSVKMCTLGSKSGPRLAVAKVTLVSLCVVCLLRAFLMDVVNRFCCLIPTCDAALPYRLIGIAFVLMTLAFFSCVSGGRAMLSTVLAPLSHLPLRVVELAW